MRTLYQGLVGDDVRAWEHFLRGINPSSQVVVDGVFNDVTKEETKAFQRASGFKGSDVDGVVGPMTMGKAMQLGFDPLKDDRLDEFGPNWPSLPSGAAPLSLAERVQIFGSFAFKPASASSNPEAIVLTDSWASKNIVTVDVPQLVGVKGAPRSGKIQFHQRCAAQLQRLFVAWEQAGMRDQVMTWGGSWVPRFVRGSRTSLSNHAWGTAFDINVQWNMLGTRGALKGKKGSVRELVLIAYEHGFFWGGWFKHRSDPMHFECCKIVP